VPRRSVNAVQYFAFKNLRDAIICKSIEWSQILDLRHYNRQNEWCFHI